MSRATPTSRAAGVEVTRFRFYEETDFSSAFLVSDDTQEVYANEDDTFVRAPDYDALASSHADLLAALEAIAEYLNRVAVTWPNSPEPAELRDRALAAIARATGGAL